MGNLLNIRRVLVAVGALVVLFVIAAVLLLGATAAESAESVYSYELKLSTSGPIDNAVLLIPLPSYPDPAFGTNVTPVNLSRVSFTNVDRRNISVRIEDVAGVPMLNLSADRITPVYENRIVPIAIMPGQNESELPKPTHVYSDRYSDETPLLVEMELRMYDAGVGHEIDTRMPIDSEPLFMPYRVVGDLNASAGRIDDTYVSAGSSGYVVEVPFILSFDAADDNVLTISTEFQGTNQWWVMGWQSNSYHERVRHEFSGACNGTYPVRGILVTGEGVY
ncbi:hypothetical protein FGU65_04925 [Methanoculleus sp. FWC-SCC1]|uniref:Uncharacterized protein n=1 Tax=Methanoculleus frigidifontis TaxID=2584085 RepID=A0ABT8M8I3_9EURY|nr:hypothetical protein [Methanoculleus sp. FWC-SCC1]MDN7024238.1 hypothetical protein [Methanoculleus sp. FWC-SCC1]